MASKFDYRSDQEKIGDLLARHLAAANLLGRTQVVRDVYRKTGKVVEISGVSRFRSQMKHVQFDESDDDPDLAAPLEASAGFSFDLPANGPAGYLRGLTAVTRDTFDGLSAQYRRDAFTIAGVSDRRLIERVRDALADIIQKGGTRAEFEAAVKRLTGDAGVAEISAFTLDTVFTTNIQKAYSLGRYEQMTDPDVLDALPFWQYLTVGDDRVRPEHSELDYFTARAEDPVWNKIYPPNGFNCRCIVIALLASEAGGEASEPGYARLPLLAQLKVPAPGFTKVFPVAA